MIKIKILFPGPKNPAGDFRKLEDLLPYQDPGVELHFGHNTIGPLHCQSHIEEALGIAAMAQVAVEAEQAGMDALVIESMGDTGLIQCREAVRIPVVGLSDSALRIAAMLGRKFGLVTVGTWHAHAIERLMCLYHLTNQYVGFEPLNLQPFFTDAKSTEELDMKIVESIIKLIKLDADTIVLGGSYFLGRTERLSTLLTDQGYSDIVIIDPLPLAIRFARMLVDVGISHSKLIYANPKHPTPVIGYPGMTELPGLLS